MLSVEELLVRRNGRVWEVSWIHVDDFKLIVQFRVFSGVLEVKKFGLAREVATWRNRTSFLQVTESRFPGEKWLPIE